MNTQRKICLLWILPEDLERSFLETEGWDETVICKARCERKRIKEWVMFDLFSSKRGSLFFFFGVDFRCGRCCRQCSLQFWDADLLWHQYQYRPWTLRSSYVWRYNCLQLSSQCSASADYFVVWRSCKMLQLPLTLKSWLSEIRNEWLLRGPFTAPRASSVSLEVSKQVEFFSCSGNL